MPRPKLFPLTPEEYIKIDEKTGCWLWQARVDRVGYGRFYDGIRDKLAHVYFYEKKT